MAVNDNTSDNTSDNTQNGQTVFERDAMRVYSLLALAVPHLTGMSGDFEFAVKLQQLSAVCHAVSVLEFEPDDVEICMVCSEIGEQGRAARFIGEHMVSTVIAGDDTARERRAGYEVVNRTAELFDELTGVWFSGIGNDLANVVFKSYR
jgi:hypothetical protein